MGARGFVFGVANKALTDSLYFGCMFRLFCPPLERVLLSAVLAVFWGAGGKAVVAQVDVVNGGFEAFSSLPTASGQFGLVDGWFHGGGAQAVPDFYHQQGSNGGDLPQTPLAKVNAFSGRAIAGFVAYTDEVNPRHEYLTGSFSEPLEVGQRYNMRFAISSGRVHDWVNAGLGVSNLAVALTTQLPSQEGSSPMSLDAQFEIHEALYHREWREISFVFTATEPFVHFVLGVFDDMPNVRREELGTRTMAYYFVDAFEIEEVGNELFSDGQWVRGEQGAIMPSEVFVPNAFTPNGDNLNDTWSWSIPAGLSGQLSIVNRWGVEVWEGGMTEGNGWDGRDKSGARCEPGTYAWRMVLEEEVEGQRAWKGWVTIAE
jgi:gliding motility-associated-like protein